MLCCGPQSSMFDVHVLEEMWKNELTIQQKTVSNTWFLSHANVIKGGNVEK